MYSLFTVMSFIINIINALAVLLLLIVMILNITKHNFIPSFEELSHTSKNCFLATLGFLIASWLVVSASDSTIIFKQYESISKQAQDMGMMWFVVGIIYIIVSFILGITGKNDSTYRKGFNMFRNRSFLMGIILCIISFLLSVT